MRVLVISDRYPPDSVGGAEISLKSIIDYLSTSTDFQIEIISFKHKNLKKSSLDENKVKIHWLSPLDRRWPPHLYFKDFKKPIFISRKLKKLLLLVEYFIRKKDLRYAINYIKEGRNLFKLGVLLSYNYFIEKDILECNSFKKANNFYKEINEIIDNFKPHIIHADNLDSILIVAYLELLVPWVAMVRDNRFLCSLHDGAAHINKIPCQSCDFACLDTSRKNLKVLYGMFKKNKEFRVQSLSKAKSIMVTSRFLEQQIIKLGISNQLNLVGNPIGDMVGFSKIYSGFQKATPPEILFVGTISEIKGICEIIQILTDLKSRLKDFRVVIAGRGFLIKKIETFIEERKIRDHVYLTGYVSREELARLYARSTVVICPTIYPEGFGRVPLEAAMFEKPVVAYCSGGLSEVVIDKITGFLIPVGDRSKLLEAIVQLINDSQLAFDLGKSAKNFISNYFKVEDIANKIASVWRSTL